MIETSFANGAGAAPARRSLLTARHLMLAYPAADGRGLLTILQDFDFELQAGEIVALLGPSGAGKSSLLRTLAGLQAPQAGNIRIRDRQLDGPDPGLGFVFQDPCLLPWLSLEENVGFGLDFRKQPRLSRNESRNRIQRAINDVGLGSARRQYPDELSGGMAQRASLARTLAREPEILLLDEPFSALDEVTRSEMQSLLLDIVARRNTAAVLVTHDIDEALLLADRILLIGSRPGRLLASWSPGLPHPRDETAPEFTTMRLEILQTLRTSRQEHH